MNRVPYRRVTPPRNTGSIRANKPQNQPENEPSGKTETLVMQFMVSGLLAAVVLLICLVNIAPLNAARDGLRQVLQGATTVEEFTAEVRHLHQTWIVRDGAPTEPETLPTYQPTARPQDPQLELPDFSDIIPLTINETTTAEEQPLKPQIPVPPIIPGLWD